MREASIHITEKKLITVLNKYFKTSNSEILQILSECSKYQITSRKLSITNDRVEKKAKMLLSSDKGEAQTFSNLLYHVRKNLKHRGITQIKEGSRDWLIVKEICRVANEFNESFDLPQREGYIEFIKIAISKMNKFSLNKIIPMAQGIADTYAANLEIRSDKNRGLTENLYQRYNHRVMERTGLSFNYREQPEKYVFFVQAANICLNNNISPENYIDSQLESFVFKESIPDPAQLVGPKAIDRAVRYLYEHGKKVKSHEEPIINFKAIRNAKNRDK